MVRLHVQPGAGRQAVTGRYGDSLAVKVAPPPQDGRANAAVVALVAELLDAPADRVELASGERSRDKRVRVRGVDPAEVTRLLDQAVHRAGERPGGGSGGGRRR
ncbi:MAG: YggU family protein [Acidimicrobiaceae bacterium]|nr:YggU family protein [Acidimicrobiaceae bacterium]